MAQPLSYWFNLFAAIPLGATAGLLELMSMPAPESPAMRLRLAEARMKHEALAACLHETAAEWRPAAGVAYGRPGPAHEDPRDLGGDEAVRGVVRAQRRASVPPQRPGRAPADAFAGTALRPPLALALDALVEQFEA